jgi:bacteriocin-like protein
MERTEGLAGHARENEELLHDEELQQVSGGNMLALGGPDTRPQAHDGSDLDILWRLHPIFIRY